MVTKQLLCRHCDSPNLTRHGLTTNGKQRYLCHDCRRYSRDDPQPNGYTDSERETILRAYDERSSLRGLTRTFGVARNTVTDWLKKEASLSSCQKLWERIPDIYRSGHCYSDFWEAYCLVIPAEHHTAAGKETGLTAHVER